MPRYKVYYEGFFIIDADYEDQAEDMRSESLYDSYEIVHTETIPEDEMFF